MTLGPLSDLQASLLAAGALAVAGVWGYNLWQERKHRQLAERVFRGQQADVLMDAKTDDDSGSANAGSAPVPDSEEAAPPEKTPAAARDFSARIEPVIGSAAEPDAPAMPAAAPESAAENIVPPAAAEAAPVIEPQPPLPAAPPIPAELVDDLVDCVIELTALEPLAGHALLAAQRRQLGLLAGRARWFGYAVTPTGAGQWHALQDYEGQHYHHLCAALQLVDRSGAISTTDLTQFIDAVRQLGAALNLRMTHPVGHELLAHAQALDEFCASVDWRLCFNLVRRDGLEIPLLGVLELAEAAALQRGEDGCYHGLDAQGRSVFTLSGLGGQPLLRNPPPDAQTTPMLAGVSLTLDVPRVADGTEVYDRMLRLGRQMVIALDGALVDEQRAALSDAVLAAIRTKISEFQQQMAQRQLPAGSRRALRLYS